MTQMNSNYEVITVNNTELTVDISRLSNTNDLFFNATEMAKRFKKRPDDFWKQEQNREYLEALVTLSAGNESDFVRAKRGGKYQGSWFHKDLALQFARWLSPMFAVQLDKWIFARLEQERISQNALSTHKSTPEWIAARADGKVERKSETDAIKEFVEYAKASGSKSPDMYYTLLTRMENDLLFLKKGKFKNLRNAMSSRQLMTVAVADGIIERAIHDGLNQRLFYKDIYQTAKARVSSFVTLYGKSEIVDRALLQNDSRIELPDQVAA